MPQEPVRRQRPTDYILGNTLALLTGLAAAFLVLLRGNHIFSVTLRTGDFLAYYGGARLVAMGHGASIYDVHGMEMMQRVLLYPLRVPAGTVLPYIYHPFWAVAQAPLGLLPFEWAFLVFTAVNCAVLVLIFFALERYTGLTGRPALACRLLGLVSLPVVECLFNGQASIVIAGCLVACFFAARSGRPWLAGTVLALAAIKPQYVAPVLLVFVVRRQWRAVAACALSSSVLLLVPALVAGWSVDTGFVHTLVHASSFGDKYGFYSDRNASIVVFVSAFLRSPASLVLAGVLSLGVLGTLVYCALRTSTTDLPIGLAVVAGVLVTPHVLVHDMTLLLLPAAVVLRYHRHKGAKIYWAVLSGYLAIPIGYFYSGQIPFRVLPLCAAGLGAAIVLTQRLTASDPALADSSSIHAIGAAAGTG